MFAKSSIDAFSKDLRSTEQPAIRALSRLTLRWATEVELTLKQLRDRICDIDQETAQDLGYDSAWEDRGIAVDEALLSIRQRIYPIIITLIEFLPEQDSETIAEAKGQVDRGLAMLHSPATIRGIMPDFEAA